MASKENWSHSASDIQDRSGKAGPAPLALMARTWNMVGWPRVRPVLIRVVNRVSLPPLVVVVVAGTALNAEKV